MTALLYRLDRHYLSGTPYARWLHGLLLVLALIAGLGGLPGRWWTSALLLLLFAGLALLFRYWRRRDYVRFAAASPPPVSPAALQASDKIPIVASGLFSVESKEQRFTWLQGFFRTFATREHAVLCHLPPSRFLVSDWPSEELGMWYIFFYPDVIEEVEWGRVAFGGDELAGVAVHYRQHIPKQGRFSRERTVIRTIYLACPEEADARRIYGDLLHDGQRPQQDGAPTGNGVVRAPLPANQDRSR